jgi:hypothetical protein
MLAGNRAVIPPHLHASCTDRNGKSTPPNFGTQVIESTTMKQRLEAHWRLFLCAAIRAAFRFAKKYDMPKPINPTT